MTYQDEAEVRRTSVGTKVLMFACAILAVLGSFWTIVWFIRAYVEAPRVGIPATIALAARESTAVAPPAPIVAPTPIGTADAQPSQSTPPGQVTAESAPVGATSEPPGSDKPAREGDASASAIADRWLPMVPPATEPTPAPAPTATAPAALATAPDNDPPVDEVTESSVPAIAGAAPLPRRKPTLAAVSKRSDPPLPRPRPDGPAPQSVWTSVPVSDDRFPQQ